VGVGVRVRAHRRPQPAAAASLTPAEEEKLRALLSVEKERTTD
jgi:hypothetical protein